MSVLSEKMTDCLRTFIILMKLHVSEIVPINCKVEFVAKRIFLPCNYIFRHYRIIRRGEKAIFELAGCKQRKAEARLTVFCYWLFCAMYVSIFGCAFSLQCTCFLNLLYVYVHVFFSATVLNIVL